LVYTIIACINISSNNNSSSNGMQTSSMTAEAASLPVCSWCLQGIRSGFQRSCVSTATRPQPFVLHETGAKV
jgi:hypothetical protein